MFKDYPTSSNEPEKIPLIFQKEEKYQEIA